MNQHNSIRMGHQVIAHSQVENEDSVRWARQWSDPITLPNVCLESQVRTWPPSKIVVSIRALQSVLARGETADHYNVATAASIGAHYEVIVDFLNHLDPCYWANDLEKVMRILRYLDLSGASPRKQSVIRWSVLALRPWYICACIQELLDVIQQTSHNADFRATKIFLDTMKAALQLDAVAELKRGCIVEALHMLQEDMKHFLHDCLAELQNGTGYPNGPYVKINMSKIAFEQKLKTALDDISTYCKMRDKEVIQQGGFALLANIYTSLFYPSVVKRVNQAQEPESPITAPSGNMHHSVIAHDSSLRPHIDRHSMHDATADMQHNHLDIGHEQFAQHGIATWSTQADTNQTLPSPYHYITHSGLHVYNHVPQHLHHAMHAHEYGPRHHWSPHDQYGHPHPTKETHPHIEPVTIATPHTNESTDAPVQSISASHACTHHNSDTPSRPASQGTSSPAHVQHPSVHAPGPHCQHDHGVECLAGHLKLRDAHAKPVPTHTPEMDALDNDPDWNYFKDQHR